MPSELKSKRTWAEEKVDRIACQEIEEESKRRFEDAKAAAKAVRKKLVYLIHLADKHVPQMYPRIVDSEKEFIKVEVRKLRVYVCMHAF